MFDTFKEGLKELFTGVVHGLKQISKNCFLASTMASKLQVLVCAADHQVWHSLTRLLFSISRRVSMEAFTSCMNVNLQFVGHIPKWSPEGCSRVLECPGP